jgi:hypothetical protein
MAQSAETSDLIEKTDWGNESSMKYFLMEYQRKHAGIQSVQYQMQQNTKIRKNYIDYHLLGTSLFNNMPHKKVKMIDVYMKETIKRVQKDQPLILSHYDIPATAMSSQRAPRELPESSQRAPISKPL